MSLSSDVTDGTDTDTTEMTETDRETDFGSTDDEPTIRANGSVVGGGRRGDDDDDDDDDDTEEEDEDGEGGGGLFITRRGTAEALDGRGGGTRVGTGAEGFKGRRAAGDVRMASP